MTKIFNILIPHHPELSYSCGKFDLSAGDLVLVPLRNKVAVGLVWSEIKEKVDYQLREVLEVMPEFKLTASMMSFIARASEYTLASKDLFLKMVLGPFFKRHKMILKKTWQTIKHIGSDVGLSSAQQSIFDQIIYSNDLNFVIDGVTGSGKTELYLQIAKKIIDDGGQALILLPEILLSNQVTKRASKFFDVDSWHSQTKMKDKDATWVGVQNGNVKVVIGARSALFLPFSNLKMIIVDEEHDMSFKQESSPIYNARDLACLRGQILGIKTLLVSATPSVETIYKTQNNEWHYKHLDSRYNHNARIKIRVANMWEAYDKQKRLCPLLHPLSVQLLESTLDNKKQSIVFLNRKGYAATTMCKHCLMYLKCKNCDVKLTYYKHKGKMKCRHCHYIMNLPGCSTCGKSDGLLMYHPGVEKVQEEIKKHFSEARVLVVTRDTEDESIMSKIEEHECDIVIGTQILAKGLHFPNMNCCIIIDANSSRFGGDIRSFERTHQIIQQTIGRIGRTEEGTAIIQTFNPASPLIKAIVENNKESFIKLELDNRRSAKAPPYSTFILVHCSAHNEKKLITWLQSTKLPSSTEQIKVFGPMRASTSKLQRRYRYQIFFRGENEGDLKLLVKQWLDSLKVPSCIQLAVDVDPLSFH